VENNKLLGKEEEKVMELSQRKVHLTPTSISKI